MARLASLARIAVLSFALSLFTACGGGQPSLPGTDGRGGSPAQGVVVTLRVGGRENYKLQLTDPADIEIARKLLAGQEAPRIPNGLIVHGGPGVNEGYSWHIDPSSVEFVDMTMEVCDGVPSDVEQDILTSERFCPWSAEVVSIEG